jgi:hypothetical protein
MTRMHKNYWIILGVTAFILSCSRNSEQVVSLSLTEVASRDGASQEDPGLHAMKIYCYACHNPEAKSHDEAIAPPLAAIKMRYKMEYPTRDKFINRMERFLNDPKEEDAIMYGALKKFGVMIKTPADDKTVKMIVRYIYDHELEQPSWLRSHMQKNRSSY